jgi:hypothetical protein
VRFSQDAKIRTLGFSAQWLKKQQDSDFCAKPLTTSDLRNWQCASTLQRGSWMRGCHGVATLPDRKFLLLADVLQNFAAKKQ